MIRTTDGDNREKKKKKGAPLQYFHGKTTQACSFFISELKNTQVYIYKYKYLFDTGDALNTVRLLPLAPKMEKKAFLKSAFIYTNQ